MKTKYECDVCGQQFNSPEECDAHECTHLGLDYNLVIKTALLIKQVDVCDYCDNSYYVYGCERDCEYKECSFINNYKDFAPTEPFHNKRAHGGV